MLPTLRSLLPEKHLPESKLPVRHSCGMQQQLLLRDPFGFVPVIDYHMEPVLCKLNGNAATDSFAEPVTMAVREVVVELVLFMVLILCSVPAEWQNCIRQIRRKQILPY